MDTYRFKHLTTSEGLSQMSVIAIEQDHLGQMWFGTRDGLNVYDGNSFRIYRNHIDDSTSISNSDILAIEEDSHGDIWVGTYNGLNRYDPVKNRFIRYFHSHRENTLSSNTVWTITEMESGEIWAGTSNGISVYDKNENKFTTIHASENGKYGLPSNYILSILQTEEGTVWIGTSKGICKLIKVENDTFFFKKYTPGNDPTEIFVQEIIAYDKNTLYIGTKNKGLFEFDTTTESFTVRNEISNEIDVDVRALNLDKEGTLWLGTSNGIYTIQADDKIHHITSKSYDSESLSHNYIKTLFVDKKGSVWIGSYYGGIDIWDKSNINFTTYRQSTAKNSLSYNVVSSIVKDTSGNLYFGTEGGGITIYDVKQKKAVYLYLSDDPQFSRNNIKTLHLEDNILWIGTYNEGVAIYDIKRKKFIHQKISKELHHLLKETGVYAIQKEKDSIVWFGTFGKGLIRYDIGRKKNQTFQHHQANKKSISNNRIRSILIDTSLNIWAGTQNGLNLISYNNKSESVIKRFFFNEKTQSGDDILTLFQDSTGTLWVGTRARGLFKYNGYSFDDIPIDTKKPVTSIYTILEGKNHTLWMSSNQGIIKYNIALEKFTLYNKDDGLSGHEFSNSAGLKVGESTFYFGGLAGVSSFNPEYLFPNEYAPQVILTGFKIRNKPVFPLDHHNILEKSITYTTSVTLSHNNAHFAIDFAMPNFINSANNQYSYRLLGLEEEWNTTTRNHANYILQKPGAYLFEVKGANNNGVWNTHPTILNIIVKPAPWRSLWAYLLYTLIIGLMIWGWVRILKSKTRLKYQLELENLQHMRNKEIHDAKMEFFTNISHEFRTPLTLISGPIQQLLENYKGSTFIYKKLVVIESNVSHLLQLINRLMDFRKLENSKFKLKAREGNIVAFLKSIFFSFSEFAKAGGYTYNFNTSNEEIQVYYDPLKLEQVVYNLISNAFRYTPNNGTISITVRKLETTITIAFEDSGIGIPESYKDRVFDRFFEIPKYDKTTAHDQQGTGIGLSIVKNIVQLHKGSIDIKTKTSQGSIFTVTLPLGNRHISPGEVIRDIEFSDNIALYREQPGFEIPEMVTDLTNLIIDNDKNTILVVEDNESLRLFIKELLQHEYNILEATDGKDAMKKALNHVPDLIICDVIIPIMTGIEVCAKIKENIKTSHIPVILLTSRTSLGDKYEGLKNGADDYISKPFNIKEFRLRIKNIIAATRRLKEKFSEKNDFSPQEITLSSLDEKLLKKALKIVENNISNDQFDIPAFSTELGVSRTLLFTKIKAWTNFTPNEFIQEIRMKRAAQLLEQNKLNISQISYKVGFKNPKYFSKCFHKKYKETPSHYAEKFSQ